MLMLTLAGLIDIYICMIQLRLLAALFSRPPLGVLLFHSKTMFIVQSYGKAIA